MVAMRARIVCAAGFRKSSEYFATFRGSKLDGIRMVQSRVFVNLRSSGISLELLRMDANHFVASVSEHMPIFWRPGNEYASGFSFG